MSTDETTAAPPPEAAEPAAPATSTELVPLTAPAPVAVVAPEKAPELVQLDPQTAAGLEQKADQFATELGALDTHSAEFQTKLKAIYDMGSQDIKDAASVSNRLLDKPTQAMEAGVFDKTSDVSTSLVQLRRTVEDLDPSRQGLFTKKKLWGLIPIFGNRLRDYFAKYQSAQSHLNAIIDALLRGQDELQQDNASIEQEKVEPLADDGQPAAVRLPGPEARRALWPQKIASIQPSDAEKAKTLQEDGLFYVRQKVQDLLTQLAVIGAGLHGAGHDPQEQPRAGQGRRPRNDDHGFGPAHGRDRLPGARRPEARARPDHGVEHDDLEHDRDDVAAAQGSVRRRATNRRRRPRSTSRSCRRRSTTSTRRMDEIDTYKVAALDSMQKTVDALSRRSPSRRSTSSGCTPRARARQMPPRWHRRQEASSRFEAGVRHRGRARRAGRRRAGRRRLRVGLVDDPDGARRLRGEGPGAALRRHPGPHEHPAETRLRRDDRGHAGDRRRSGQPRPGLVLALEVPRPPPTGQPETRSRGDADHAQPGRLRREALGGQAARLDRWREGDLAGHQPRPRAESSASR